ncbi:unnamed protein product [Blepharisma stoltei]|uniref:Uncharacterized protein n=1 Tax=Blepharisma stoltei TaxID=1481888 RepID=A0AAU9IM64_9CILI|nr:unnamed protein product [Blepharisma stoltei]
MKNGESSALERLKRSRSQDVLDRKLPVSLKDFIEISKERVNKVRSGQRLASTVDLQKKKFLVKDELNAIKNEKLNEAVLRKSRSDLKLQSLNVTPKRVEYENTGKLLENNKFVEAHPAPKPMSCSARKLSSAMQEYLEVPEFSPELEKKKTSNLDSFFIEKFQYISSYLDSNKNSVHLPKISEVFSAERKSTADKKKINQIENKIKSKSKDPFKRKMLFIDKMIKEEIRASILQQQTKEENLQKTVNTIEFARNKKIYIPPDKRFVRLNIKAKNLLQKFDENFVNTYRSQE